LIKYRRRSTRCGKWHLLAAPPLGAKTGLTFRSLDEEADGDECLLPAVGSRHSSRLTGSPRRLGAVALIAGIGVAALACASVAAVIVLRVLRTVLSG
jgi:hypothetical protein